MGNRQRREEGQFQVGERPASWMRDGPLGKRPLIVLAHGAGAPMTSPFMAFCANELVARGSSVARFNFPYMELQSRSGRRRPPDSPRVLLDAWRAMLDVARGWRRSGPLLIGGKSMGGRIASMLLAADRPADVQGAVYLGYPLHPPGRRDKLRADHLPDVGVPQLFLTGSRDSLCDLTRLEPVLEKIGAGAALHVVEGADHSLARSRKEPFAGAEEWLERLAGFVVEVAG